MTLPVRPLNSTMVAIEVDPSMTSEYIREQLIPAALKAAKQGTPYLVTTCFDDDPREGGDIPEMQDLCKRLVDAGIWSILATPEHSLPGILDGWTVFLISGRMKIPVGRSLDEPVGNDTLLQKLMDNYLDLAARVVGTPEAHSIPSEEREHDQEFIAQNLKMLLKGSKDAHRKYGRGVFIVDLRKQPLAAVYGPQANMPHDEAVHRMVNSYKPESSVVVVLVKPGPAGGEFISAYTICKSSIQ